MNPENKPPKRTSLGKVFTWIAISFLAFIILLIMIIPDTPETAKVEENTKAEIPVEKKEIKKVENQIYSISPSPDKFRTEFNKYAEEFGLDLRMPKIQRNSDGSHIFQADLTDHLSLLGSLNRDDTLYDILLLSTNDGKYDKIADQLLAMGGVITAQNPKYNADDRKRILTNLGLFKKDLDVSSLDEEYVENNIAYKLYFIDNILFLSISPENGEINN
ncbi:MAG: hypothetical protein ABS44_11625 [Chryseobacterium sp. SCN 40-13]|nr:MAG: hypothetical protein ABS44_11625 [Chryseobacterium sp. SCN 40-13]